MKSSRAVKLIAEFLGFLFVSIGATLLCVGVLLVLSGLGPGDIDTASAVKWLDLVLGCGISGCAMVTGGIYLMRRFKG
ncbi:MAG: hypothetical protein QUS33_15035 [Dehalococcoidia bacterium]|nr:hypothetical protein [Dehalococcoidia bacterium]